MLQTRQQAAGTLRNLAAAPRRNKIRLCEYENGLLLDVLTDAVLNDVDDGVKKRAFATINNLAFHDTAMAMVKHPALVLALKNALLGRQCRRPQAFGERHSHGSGTKYHFRHGLLFQLTRTPGCRESYRECRRGIAKKGGSQRDQGRIKL